MKKFFTKLMLTMALLMASFVASAQERRPIDSQHPLWMIHIDVWNSADPQKIIDLVPDDIKPYVCMNLSLSCQYDKDTDMYRMPRCAVRTYKSWASVCQANGMWFTCQPASGGHTHIQDDDLETFEYFFKAYPNFLGWNYAEQFWGFDEAGDESSSTQSSRIALFAKLVPMHHKYGGVLTVSFCGNIWSHPLNPIGMMKRNKDLLKACQDYPEAILWLYKYTTSSCFYNNESVTFGPFISGLAKNFGVRYDNCGWNGALESLLGKDHGKKYPGAAGIGTVMEQTCVNGGAVWDGPELIWTEDFKGLNDSNVEGYTRRNWGVYPNFQGIWTDMWRKIIDGTMYIPTREEVVNKTKIVVINNVSSGNDEQKYAAWGDLYDGLYKQTDPFNKGNGQWMDNYCYFKKTGRYGAIPIVIDLYDELAKSIPVQVKKSAYTSRWSSQTKKVNDFNAQYPEVSTGDLYVNRYKNQLVTYTPYTYLNSKTSASAKIPLQYNTCETLELTWDQLSGGVIREFADHIDFYLNNFRDDISTQQTDKIVVTGVASEPTYTLTKHKSSETGAATYAATATASYDAENKTYTLSVKHRAPVDISIQCSGTATERNTDPLPAEALPLPKQPEEFVGPIIIEAENMDRKSVKGIALTHSGWWAQDVSEFAGMGYIDLGTSTSAALRHQLKLKKGGDYDIYVRYCNSTKKGNIRIAVNGKNLTATCEKVKLNDWHKVKVTATLKEGTNNLVLTNIGGVGMYIDQIIYSPVGAEADQYKVTIREAEHGKVEADVEEAAEGSTVTLTAIPDAGCKLKELRVVNSIYYTMNKTIPVNDSGIVTFTMPDDNVTIQPVFADATAVYTLDFANVLTGTLPQGWRATQGSNEVHEYPNSYSSGARTFAGFTGYQGKAFYWRDDNAEYGKQSAYPLNLKVGDYKLTFATAAWKGTPKYKAQIINASTNKVVAESSTYTAAPNANGNTAASIKSAKAYELPFTIETAGKYLIRFVDMTSGDGMHEFLLAECRINTVAEADAIIAVQDKESNKPAGIYSPSGVLLQHMQPGLNIIRTKDGEVKKVLLK